jgi:hypothetical protein
LQTRIYCKCGSTLDRLMYIIVYSAAGYSLIILEGDNKCQRTETESAIGILWLVYLCIFHEQWRIMDYKMVDVRDRLYNTVVPRQYTY